MHTHNATARDHNPHVTEGLQTITSYNLCQLQSLFVQLTLFAAMPLIFKGIISKAVGAEYLACSNSESAQCF